MSWTTDCASFLFLRVQQTVIQHCCSRVVSCRKPAKFWQGKGIETDCPLLFVAAAAATFCERWKDGYQPTRTTDIRNVHCLSIIESEKSKREATTATTTSQHELLLLLPAAAFCVHHTPQSVTVVGDFSNCSVVVHYSLSPSQSRILL